MKPNLGLHQTGIIQVCSYQIRQTIIAWQAWVVKPFCSGKSWPPPLALMYANHMLVYTI